MSAVQGTAASPAAHDRLGRALRDLRISVTDRCNFRCVYCMPKEVFGKDYPFLERKEILSFEEIARLARIFRDRRLGLYALGLLLALAAYVPLVGLVAPVIFGLAYIRYLLGALQGVRAIEAPYGPHANKELARGTGSP